MQKKTTDCAIHAMVYAVPLGNQQRSFRQGEMTLRVRASSEDLAWLAEFLGPTFSEDAEGSPLAEISFGCDAEGDYASPSMRGSQVVAFSLDSGPLRLFAAPVEGGLRLVSPRARVAFQVSDDKRHTAITYRNDRLSGRFYLMRVVREYAHNFALRTGALILHAAGVSIDGITVGIAGPKGAGKTTLLLQALSRVGSVYLSNDRLLVRPGAPPLATGVPTIVAIQPGTRKLLPDVAHRIRDAGDFRRHAHERAAIGPSHVEQRDDVWDVSPSQLSLAMDRPACGSAPLSALLFLHPDIAGNGGTRRIGETEATEALRDSLLGHAARRLGSDLFVGTAGEAPSDSEILSRCRALASSIACFSWCRDVDLSGLAARLQDT